VTTVAFGIFGSRAMSVLSWSRGSAGTQTNRPARMRGESPRPLDPPGLAARFLHESRQAGSRSVQCLRRPGGIERSAPFSPTRLWKAHAPTGGNPVARRLRDHERRPRRWTSRTGWRDLRVAHLGGVGPPQAVHLGGVGPPQAVHLGGVRPPRASRRSQGGAHAEADWCTGGCMRPREIAGWD
jgi:hypothetical protein